MGSPRCPTCGSGDETGRGARCADKWHLHATPTPPAPADDARPMVTGGGLIKFDRRADDASGAEAMRRFPIIGGPSIPWWVIAPHEAQAMRNHGGQTLERLAERGGLSPTEALCVIEDRAWSRGRDARADHDALAAMVIEWDRPAPVHASDDAVEEARAAFAASGSAWARHQFECPGAAFEGPGAEWFVENDALRIKAIHDHDALLAAERDAALRREKGGGEAPPPADPTNPAPAAASGAGCTEQKEP